MTYRAGFYAVLLPGSAGNFSDFGGNVKTEAVSGPCSRARG